MPVYSRAAGVAGLGFALLAAPWLGLTVVPAADGGYGIVAGAYLFAAVLALWLNISLSEGPARSLSLATTLLAVAGATLAGAVAGPEYLLLVGLAGSCFVYYLAWLEDRPNLVFGGSSLVYLALTQAVAVAGYDTWAYGAVLVLPAVILFVIGYKVNQDHADYGTVLRYSGLVGPMLASLVTLVAGGAAETPMICLAAGGAMLLAEGFIENSLFMAITAGSIMLAAYDWLLVFTRVYEAQVYALPWVVYFAYLARKHKERPKARLTFMALALGSLTLPIMAESISDNGVYYGMEVIFLGLALSLVGSATMDRFVMWWGGGSALIGILYWVPKYFWHGSEIPLVCASLGLVALAITVMAKYRREDPEETEN